jgi:hypothetical protein
MLYMARAPIYVRQLTDDEHAVLKTGLRSRDAFVLRRCQILLASTSGKRASQIGAELGCDTDTALNAINAFNRVGLGCLTRGSPVPHTIERGFDAVQTEALRALLHQSPRNFGKETSLWTLELAAEVSFEQGLTPQRVTGKRYGRPYRGWVWAGRGPSRGSPVLIRSMCEKKRPRPADFAGQPASGICLGLPG